MILLESITQLNKYLYMKNHFLDAMKGIAKLFGMVFYIAGYPFYKFGYWLLNMKSSRDIMLDNALKEVDKKKGNTGKARRKPPTRKVDVPEMQSK